MYKSIHLSVEIQTKTLKKVEKMRMADPSVVINRIRWNEEISVEEGLSKLERTFFPFKEACLCYAHALCVCMYRCVDRLCY